MEQLLEREARDPNGREAARPTTTFDAILAPVRKGWEESGLSEEAVDQLFDETRKAVRQRKSKGRPE